MTEKARKDDSNWDKYKSLKIIYKIILPFLLKESSIL